MWSTVTIIFLFPEDLHLLCGDCLSDHSTQVVEAGGVAPLLAIQSHRVDVLLHLVDVVFVKILLIVEPVGVVLTTPYLCEKLVRRA